MAPLLPRPVEIAKWWLCPQLNNAIKQLKKKYGPNARIIPYGTMGQMLNGPLRGQSVILSYDRVKIVLGFLPKEIKEIEWYGGDGEKFLYAYFKFALENAVAGYIGAKAVDAVEAL